VKLGDIQENNYQVLEGLKAGEKIIISGLLNLTNGAPIMPASEEAANGKP
jgi:multidrug efflux pump subunit AcrA (membrane-fusion protein)